MVSVEMVRDAQVISDSTKREKIVNQNTVNSKKELENLDIRFLSITDVRKEQVSMKMVVYLGVKLPSW